MNFLRLSALAFALLVSASACNKADDGTDCPTIQDTQSPGIAAGGCVIVDPCATPCTGEEICTMDFRAITVSAVDAANNPIALDSFVVTDLSGAPLSANGQLLFEIAGDGRITIVNDGWMQGHQGMQMPVQAKGFFNGTLLFNQAFTIGADCCHVYKAAGPDVITVQ